MQAPGRRVKQRAKRRRAEAYNGRTWRRCRAAHLQDHPLCEDCMTQGLTRIATDVHHKHMVADRPDKMYEPSNLMSLCQSCHSKRTARGE